MLRSFYKKSFAIAKYPVWLALSMAIAIGFMSAFLKLFNKFVINIDTLPSSVVDFSLAALMYVLILLIFVGVPYFMKKTDLRMRYFGLDRFPKWSDIILVPAGFVVYLLISVILMMAVSMLFPSFNIDQIQDVGFEGLSQNYHYYLAFVALVIVAPLAEELIFRGFLFYRLRKVSSFLTASLIVSIVFGFAHGAWNVGINTFALSMVMCFLREKTGSLWPAILIHMSKNGIAFYLLFISPLL